MTCMGGDMRQVRRGGIIGVAGVAGAAGEAQGGPEWLGVSLTPARCCHRAGQGGRRWAGRGTFVKCGENNPPTTVLHTFFPFY